MKAAKKIQQNINSNNEQKSSKMIKPKGKKKLSNNSGAGTANTKLNTANYTLSLPQTVEAAKKLYNETEPDADAVDQHTNTIEATKEIAKTVEDLNRLEKLRKQLLATEDRLKLEVMNYMQMHTYLSFDSFTIASWKRYTRKSFEQTKFKDDFPDLYSSYLHDITIRSFKLI